MYSPKPFEQTSHRPWPIPRRAWRMAMGWNDLAFLHWEVPAAALRALIPPAIDLDTFEGRTWLAVTPFRMSGTRHRLTPPPPGLSAFPELNVRTYVRIEDKPGVWFFSLDVTNPLAVWGARLTYKLPYYRARMSAQHHGREIRYTSERTHRGAPPAALAVRYAPNGEVFNARPGTLEHWLTERYCLYAADRRGKPYRAEIHHVAWPLQPAEATIQHNSMTRGLNLALPDAPPLVHFARQLKVVAWPLEPV